MYNAPSVAYPVGRCAFQRYLWAGLFGGVMVVMTAWALNQALSVWWFLSWLPVALGALDARRALQARGLLLWQGQFWCLGSEASDKPQPWQTGRVRLAWDLQWVLLLHWTPTSDEDAPATPMCARVLSRRSQWLWLAQENAPERWLEVRRAVHAHS